MNELELGYSKLEFVTVVDSAVGKMEVFDGVAVVVAVGYVTAVEGVERCDVLAEASVAAVVESPAAVAAADGGACGLEEQGHSNPLPWSCLAERRTGCSFAADSTKFEYSIEVEFAMVVAAE